MAEGVLYLTLFHHHFPGLCLADDQSISYIDYSDGLFLEGWREWEVAS